MNDIVSLHRRVVPGARYNRSPRPGTQNPYPQAVSPNGLNQNQQQQASIQEQLRQAAVHASINAVRFLLFDEWYRSTTYPPS